MTPAWPALALLLGSLVLLVPTLGERLVATGRVEPLRRTRAVVAALAIAALVPLVAVAALALLTADRLRSPSSCSRSARRCASTVF